MVFRNACVCFLVVAVIIGSTGVVSGDILSAVTQDLIVTQDNAPNSHVYDSPANNSAFSVDLQGVVRFFIDTNPDPGWGSICSGALLWTGRHLLTAAHCVTDSSGTINVIDGADGNRAYFDTAAGEFSRTFTSDDVTVHPVYDGSTSNGYDVALIDLGTPVTSDVTRYNINSSFGAELDVTHVKVGYGKYGNGVDGHDGANGGLDGSRRAGQNMWEDDGLGSDNGGGDYGISNVDDISNNTTQLTFDFDSGLATNDAFEVIFGQPQDVGVGADEVNSAPGDSGGPTFIYEDGEWVIAGVTSYGFTFEDSTADSDLSGDQPDSSWGEFSVDARIAHPSTYSFIATTIPEPGAGLLLAGGCVWVVLHRRRRV